MDATRLEYFLTVADARTLSDAAAQLHVTQPSLSAALRTFEHECGFTLFDRLGRRLVLNDAGRRLVPHAREVRAALRASEACVQDLRGLFRGEVTIASTALMPLALSRLIAGSRRQNPGITVSVVPLGSSERVAAAVMGGEVDVGVVNGEWDEDGRRSILIEEGESILLVPADDPLADRESVTLRDLGDRDLITSAPASYSGQVFRDALAAGVPLTPTVHCPHRPAVPTMVKAGVGIAVIGRSMHNPDDPHLVAVGFDPRRTFPTSLIFRGGPCTPATNAFVSSVRADAGVRDLAARAPRFANDSRPHAARAT